MRSGVRISGALRGGLPRGATTGGGMKGAEIITKYKNFLAAGEILCRYDCFLLDTRRKIE